jgi:hypothetical protein
MSQNNDLEFVQVPTDDHDDLNNYMDPTQNDSNTSAMGSWILNQSKV